MFFIVLIEYIFLSDLHFLFCSVQSLLNQPKNLFFTEPRKAGLSTGVILSSSGLYKRMEVRRHSIIPPTPFQLLSKFTKRIQNTAFRSGTESNPTKTHNKLLQPRAVCWVLNYCSGQQSTETVAS
jgi:hypothetical protein